MNPKTQLLTLFTIAVVLSGLIGYIAYPILNPTIGKNLITTLQIYVNDELEYEYVGDPMTRQFGWWIAWLLVGDPPNANINFASPTPRFTDGTNVITSGSSTLLYGAGIHQTTAVYYWSTAQSFTVDSYTLPAGATLLDNPKVVNETLLTPAPEDIVLEFVAEKQMATSGTLASVAVVVDIAIYNSNTGTVSSKQLLIIAHDLNSPVNFNNGDTVRVIFKITLVNN